jgi:hypothetical protein
MSRSRSWWSFCPRATLSGYLAAVMALGAAVGARAQDWDVVGFIQHSTYQAVAPHPEDPVVYVSAYTGGFPLRLRGVVLNNIEDWLDPTADYDPDFHLFQLGGEAEFYVQALDLPGDSWDDGDFGGTACWMGQNYGNHPWHQDPLFSYTDEQWYAELDRLQLWHEGTAVSPLIRAGCLVEIRARAGLYYAGKMNVNERHNNDPVMNFEIVILDEDYGLPTPAAIRLSAIKDPADVAIFDPDRAAGGERYQSTLVKVRNVRLLDNSGWGRNSDLTLVDNTGRSLEIHLGLNDSFETLPAPEGYFNVVGIMDQASSSGTGGYRLLAMHAGDFAPVPEPTTPTLLAAGAASLLIGFRRTNASRRCPVTR